MIDKTTLSPTDISNLTKHAELMASIDPVNHASPSAKTARVRDLVETILSQEDPDYISRLPEYMANQQRILEKRGNLASKVHQRAANGQGR